MLSAHVFHTSVSIRNRPPVGIRHIRNSHHLAFFMKSLENDSKQHLLLLNGFYMFVTYNILCGKRVWCLVGAFPKLAEGKGWRKGRGDSKEMTGFEHRL